MIDAGIAYATHGLEKLNLPPPRKLELIRKYKITSWIKPAVTSLLDTSQPIGTFSSEIDVERMHPRVYAIVTRARELILRERTLIADTPPTMPYNSLLRSYNCVDHITCRQVWKEVWWAKVARAILSPRNPLRLEDGLDFISTLEFTGMARDCKSDMLDYLRREGALCRNLILISDGALSAICDAYGIAVTDL